MIFLTKHPVIVNISCRESPSQFQIMPWNFQPRRIRFEKMGPGRGSQAHCFKNLIGMLWVKTIYCSHSLSNLSQTQTLVYHLELRPFLKWRSYQILHSSSRSYPVLLESSPLESSSLTKNLQFRSPRESLVMTLMMAFRRQGLAFSFLEKNLRYKWHHQECLKNSCCHSWTLTSLICLNR